MPKTMYCTLKKSVFQLMLGIGAHSNNNEYFCFLLNYIKLRSWKFEEAFFKFIWDFYRNWNIIKKKK